jgi:hypothetical protein
VAIITEITDGFNLSQLPVFMRDFISAIDKYVYLIPKDSNSLLEFQQTADALLERKKRHSLAGSLS